MSLDTSKLQSVRTKSGGKIIARCPACAGGGGDLKGEHLAIFPDGKFACVANPGDSAHRKEIWKLAGASSAAPRVARRCQIKSVATEPSRTIQILGQLGRD